MRDPSRITHPLVLMNKKVISKQFADSKLIVIASERSERGNLLMMCRNGILKGSRFQAYFCIPARPLAAYSPLFSTAVTGYKVRFCSCRESSQSTRECRILIRRRPEIHSPQLGGPAIDHPESATRSLLEVHFPSQLVYSNQ